MALENAGISLYNFGMNAKQMVTELRGRGMSAKAISRAVGCSVVTVYCWQNYGAWPSEKYADKLRAVYERKAHGEDPRK